MTKFTRTIRPLEAARRKAWGAAVIIAACALLAAQPARADGAISGAGKWMIVDSDPSGCWVETEGDNVHIKLVMSTDGAPILVAGRPDWAHSNNEMRVGLTIDGGPQETLRGGALINLVLIPLDGAERVERLRKAKRISVHLPWGDFTAGIDGSGVALDALIACQRAKGL